LRREQPIHRAALVIEVRQGHEPIRIGVGQLLEKDRIHDAEDGRCGTDPQGEDQEGDGREATVPPEGPQGEPDVVPQLLHHVSTSAPPGVRR